VLSGHALAMERMRWSEHYKPQVPKKWWLCRFYKDHLEDAIHVMFVCKQSLLVEIRNAFFEKLFKTHPELHGVYSDPGLFFKDLLVKEKVIRLIGKLAYNVFEVFRVNP
ncbi:hypothetical protein B0H17DRAFT_836555, partial [Mycena rosella]